MSAVRYRVEKSNGVWSLTAVDSARSIICTGDRDALVSLAESIVKDVGGEVQIDSLDDGPEAVIRHRGNPG